MRSRYLIPLAVAGVAAIAVPATAGTTAHPAAHPAKQSVGTRPALTTPVPASLKFHTNNGRGTTIWMSSAGNIVRFTSPDPDSNGPRGYEHIGVGALSEGYVLCYNGSVDAFDTGSSSSGFNSPIVSGRVVTRTTTDGKLRFKQTFTFGTSPGATNLIIAMDVTNLTGSPVSSVILRRQVDFDIDTNDSTATWAQDGWAGFVSSHARTKAAVMAFHDPSEAPAGLESHGIMLRTIANSGASAISTVTASILDSSCSPASASFVPGTTVYRGDYGDSMAYPIGTIPAHATKSVSVGYLRY